MAETATIKVYKMQWQEFWKNWFFWLLSIPVNVIPVVFKQIDYITSENFQGPFNLFFMTLADFDFSFISVSVLFVLCLEDYFIGAEVPKFFRFFRVFPFIGLCILLVLYCIFYFNPTLFPMMQQSTQTAYNGVIIGLTILLGLVINIGNSMKEGGAT